MATQKGQTDEQFMLLDAQSASVHERRRALRERQRVRLAALSLLVIPQDGDGGCLSPGSSEEPRSRFSHSSLPSPVVSWTDKSVDGTDISAAQATHSPVLPPSPPKRKSILARLMKAFVPLRM